MYNIICIFLFIFILAFTNQTLATYRGGEWKLLQKSVGISAMHMQLMPSSVGDDDDVVVIFDRTDFGPSNLTLPPSQCRDDPNNKTSKKDCTAHSIAYNVKNNTFRPLHILTNTWCSSGATLANGKLLQTGGNDHGDRVIRMFESCPTCDWEEFPNQLLQSRWYATNLFLPDGRAIIIGGRNQSNYEFFPKTKLFQLKFLSETKDPWIENNLYPFVFLNVDGSLFIFANNRAILFDYNKNVVVRTYPTIPGGHPRCFPSTGSAVLLPLKKLELDTKITVEVLVCGGTPTGSFWNAQNKSIFETALITCARMEINDPNPTWVMEDMPMARAMGEMIILPTGDVLIINGAGSGAAGWDLGRNPVLNPVIYHPDRLKDSRFEVMTPTEIPRMYHSCAILLRDGRVLVGGSNPHKFYNFTNVLFPTELSLEAYSPPYLDSSNSGLRPIVEKPISGSKIAYGRNFTITFSGTELFDVASIKITMIRPPFNTHSFSMNQRLLELTKTSPVTTTGSGSYQVNVMSPGSTNIAPPGFYMLFVVNQDVPSSGIWVQLITS